MGQATSQAGEATEECSEVPSDSLESVCPCTHGCTIHKLEPVNVGSPPEGLTFKYGSHNPLLLSGRTGSSGHVDYAMAAITYPPHPLRPERLVVHHYPGVECPIVDDRAAIFELHCEGPYLKQRRTMLRSMVLETAAFARGDIEQSLYDGFASMDECLSEFEKGEKEHATVLGCGGFSMVFIVKDDTIYTGGVRGWCAVLKPSDSAENVICFPNKMHAGAFLVCESAGQMPDWASDYCKSSAIEVNKVKLGIGSIVVLFGIPRKEFVASSLDASDLWQWSSYTLAHYSMSGRSTTSPLMILRLK